MNKWPEQHLSKEDIQIESEYIKTICMSNQQEIGTYEFLENDSTLCNYNST